jgi:hypothetical protein
MYLRKKLTRSSQESMASQRLKSKGKMNRLRARLPYYKSKVSSFPHLIKASKIQKKKRSKTSKNSRKCKLNLKI